MKSTSSERLSPPTRRGRPLTAAKRNAILAGATDVFATRRFEDVLVDDVARRAGVGKGTLYRYFASKEDLYVGTVVASFSELRAGIENRLLATADPVEKLHLLAEGVVRHLWHRRLFHALINRDDRDLSKTLPVWEKERDGFRALVAKILSEGEKTGRFRLVDGKRAAIFFFAILRAANVNREPNASPESVAREVVEVFVRGVRA
jgi:AcrR family transcriptional regulator